MTFHLADLFSPDIGFSVRPIICRFFSDSLKLQLIDARSGKMDMHWIASAAVLVIMAVLSAYREALKNEPIRPAFEWGGAPYAEEFES
ncbi:hypothetical protein [Burkholderia stagnalis]|uniref:hypothetical protein n=1 Tax=Burkholderia stagnalis TaxID=1503054 RepID=UPI000AFC29DB|nr:hypothetical protein [Burkholderia stagnalis]MDY7801792.1 hypothetical protein [Burkholderia stagnalis]